MGGIFGIFGLLGKLDAAVGAATGIIDLFKRAHEAYVEHKSSIENIKDHIEDEIDDIKENSTEVIDGVKKLRD